MPTAELVALSEPSPTAAALIALVVVTVGFVACVMDRGWPWGGPKS